VAKPDNGIWEIWGAACYFVNLEDARQGGAAKGPPSHRQDSRRGKARRAKNTNLDDASSMQGSDDESRTGNPGPVASSPLSVPHYPPHYLSDTGSRYT
jgi:hypothetical protein